MSNQDIYVETKELKIGDVINRDGGGYSMTILKIEKIEPQQFSSYIWHTFLVTNNIDPDTQPVYRHRFNNFDFHRVIGNIGDKVDEILSNVEENKKD